MLFSFSELVVELNAENFKFFISKAVFSAFQKNWWKSVFFLSDASAS